MKTFTSKALLKSLRAKKKANGFTLIELMVVVAIVGILTAVGLPELTKAQNKSKDEWRFTAVDWMNRAQERKKLSRQSLFLAVDLCLDDRNILAGLVKRKADLPLLLINRHSIIHFELSHQIVNFDSEFLFTRLYLPFQKNNIGLMK